MGQITKQIKGIIIFKHKKEADWKESSYVPDEGEQIIYDPDASHPSPRIKIGDGEQVADALPFTTAEIPTKLSEFEDDVGYLKTETDPTVPAWAKAETKPSYTAAEVGALPDTTVIPTVPTNVSAFTNDVGYLTEHQSLEGLATEAYVQAQIATIPTPDVSGQIGEHNVSTLAHNDIRLLIEGLTTRLNTLANSDDTTLDQMAELVKYIKDNRELIEGVTTNKVNVSDIINDLTTNVTNKPLSAAQGVALKALIDAIDVPTKVSQLANDSGFITAADAPDEIYVGNGTMPESATIQILMDGSDEEGALKDELKEYIDGELAVELAKRGQLKPEFANSVEECTDTTKMYVLPDGFIYAYIEGLGTGQGSEVLTVKWNDNNRLSTSDGGLRTGATGYTASDYIDLSVLANVGETLSITGLNFSSTNASRSIVSKANGAFLAAYYPSTTSTHLIGSSGVTIKKLKSDNSIVLERVSATTDGKTYTVAFCGYGSGANAVVTRTGEVKMDGVMTWASTGHAFVPADYEDRIIALETSNTALKNDNTSLKTRVKALEDAAVHGNSVPDYVIAEAEEVADKVLAVRNADSFVIGLASDLHTDGTDTSSVSVLHAGQGMDVINSLTQLDLVALLGDYEIYYFNHGDDNAANENEDARKSFKHAKKAFSSVAKGAPFMMLQGNHDQFSNDTTEEACQKYYAYIGANNVGTVTDWDNRFRNYGYRDFPDQRMRVIYLNSVDVGEGENTENCWLTAMQLSWLVNTALDFTDKSGWSFIVGCHHPLNWWNMDNLLAILDAYNGKASGSVTVDGTTVAYDFTNATAEFIAHFHGHLHNFRVETLGSNGVLSITIPNACFGRNNEYGLQYDEDMTRDYGDADANGNQRQFNKTTGTAEDTAFNVVVIDRSNQKIHCFNYGAGIDREISY